MSYIEVSTPATVPPDFYVRLREHTRVGVTPEDDAILQALGRAAIADFELHTGRAAFTQTRKLHTDSLQSKTDLLTAPVSAVTAFTYADEDGTEQTIDAANYFLTSTKDPACIVFKNDYELPTTESSNPYPVTVTMTTGYGNSVNDLPELVLSGLLLFAGHLYDNRDTSGAAEVQHIRDLFFSRYRINFLGDR
jgi:uncharacterized phiE125 gp8 family phage protein